MDIRNLLNINAVNEVINDHNLPDYLYSSDLKKLDTFVFNKYNKSLVEYCIVYLDKNNNIKYRAETLYIIENNLNLRAKCSQTFSSNGTIIVTAHDRELNNDCDFGFIINSYSKDNNHYFKRFKIDIDIKPIWDVVGIKYVHDNLEFFKNKELKNNRLEKIKETFYDKK